MPSYRIQGCKPGRLLARVAHHRGRSNNKQRPNIAIAIFEIRLKRSLPPDEFWRGSDLGRLGVTPGQLVNRGSQSAC